MSELVSAIIVDDEAHNRSILNTLLKKYGMQIKVVDEAANADEAYLKIAAQKPQLVFLDIKMPGKSGFDLLKMFKEITFEVVFVTAYEEYAISAFEFNALGYVLKPIDYTKLGNTLKKVMQRLKDKAGSAGINNFISSINDKTGRLDKVSVHHGNKVIFVPISDIVLVESEDSNAVIHTADRKKYYSSRGIKDFDEFLKFHHFFRVNRGTIINMDCIVSYTKGEPCLVELKNCSTVEISRRRKTELLEVIKHRKIDLK